MDALTQQQASALQLKCWQDGPYLHIQAAPPESASLPPTDLVAILDVSGSMDTEALVKNKEGIKESQGMTILSVLKHAVKTTIYNLSKKDRFGLVSFSDKGDVEYDLNFMEEGAQKKASDILDKLKAEGRTNLWSGLFQGLEILRNKYSNNRKASLILLTDGEPNEFPESSFEDMLRKYRAKYPKFIFTLYTIALGKNLDSQLLGNLANIGGGQYSFIPCPGFMGTIFVNTFTNVLTTMCSNAKLTVQLEDDNEIADIVGFKDQNLKKSLKSVEIPIGDIKYGQTRDIILKIGLNHNLSKNQSFGTVSLKTWNLETQSQLITTCECKVENATNFEKIQLKTQLARLLLCDSITDVYNITPENEQNLQKGQERMKVCVNQIQELQAQQQKLAEEEDDLDGPHNKMIESMNGLLKDAAGEVSLSVLKPDFWRQWGRHFYPSIRNAHFKQVCNNFIDPGVQFYGGKMFRELRNQVEETFMKIPPPQATKKKQSNQQQKQQNVQQQKPRSPSPVQMDAYYDCGGGGCFGGQCLVKTLNGTKRIDSIRKGDIIVNNNQGQSSKVIAIVKITSKTPIIANKIGQLVITPKHPIFLNGKWVKPIDVADANQFEFCQTFFNLVLDSNHTALIEGIVCTTLGHMIKGQKVEHPYFGTKLIIQDLQKMNGWNDGYIQIQNEQFKRDLDTGKVNGIQQQ